VNQFAPDVYLERIERLLVGLEVVDALSQLRITEPIRVVREIGRKRLPRELRLRLDRLLDGTEGQVPLGRHETCLYSVFQGEIAGERGGVLPNNLVLRVTDPMRRYVPRRLLVDLTQPRPVYILTRNIPGEPVRAPLELCPGSNASLQSRTTTIHGPVRKTGLPARWARLELRQRSVTNTGALVGVAHGDDRGEYVLVVDARAGTVGALQNSLDLQLGVFLHNPPAVAADKKLSDPFWDLPIDTQPLAQTSAGVTVNGNYGAPTRLDITVQLGRDTRIEVVLP
jgi:hypothetical protein